MGFNQLIVKKKKNDYNLTKLKFFKDIIFKSQIIRMPVGQEQLETRLRTGLEPIFMVDIIYSLENNLLIEK